ncbi:MAG: hypothetical protein O3B01_12465 [Planctomycetota bacterium]|nr:hypothetical protein [Planctomycetota bacterium]
MAELRQKLLVLYLSNSDLGSSVCGWAVFDGTGKETHSSGDADESPYQSVLAAMRDGWRVIQFPQLLPQPTGQEYSTSFMRYEYILEKLETIDG